MSEWKDTSSYSRGERGVKAPTSWTFGSSPFDITVHRLRGVDDTWFVSVHGLDFSSRDLWTDDVEEAKKLALEAAAAVVERWSDVIAKASATLKEAP